MEEMDGWLKAATAVTAIGCGLNGGVFLAFSSFVMTGLRKLRPDQGVAAMQAINASVPASLFGLLLTVTAAACVGLAVVAVAGWGNADRVPLLVGSGLYLLGVIVVTGAFHIPRNDALDAVDATSSSAAAAWHNFVGPWVAGNHVRTLACVAAAGFLTRAVA